MEDLITTLRKPKILDMAIFDWVGTAIGAYIISEYIIQAPFLVIFMITIIAGIIVHMAFDVNTMFGYYLGLNKKPLRDD